MEIMLSLEKGLALIKMGVELFDYFSIIIRETGRFAHARRFSAIFNFYATLSRPVWQQP